MIIIIIIIINLSDLCVYIMVFHWLQCRKSEKELMINTAL